MTVHLLGHIEKFNRQNVEIKNKNCKNQPLMNKNSINEQEYQMKPYKRRIIWRNVIILAYLHGVAVYSAINITHCKWQVSLFDFFIGSFAAIGITAGAHRLWTHKCK